MGVQLSHLIKTLLPTLLQPTALQATEAILSAVPKTSRALISDHLTDLIRVNAYSPWLRQTLAKDHERFITWLKGNSFGLKLQPETLRAEVCAATQSCETVEELKHALCTIHLREEVIIAWRDLNSIADLKENLQHISQLAEIMVTAGLTWLTQWLVEKHGMPIGELTAKPTQLALIAMGKLGGGELNFHSDIDLIAVYGEAGETNGAQPLANQEFFTRLIRALVDLLQTPGEDGRLYNVDLRLRPFGDGGALVASGDALEAYYTRHGREWERYALIKARPVAGDIAFGNQLLCNLSPFIYRRYLDYGAFQSLRELKHEIDRQVKRKSRQYDVKLGRGGIREIEFIAQTFQLVHGGRDNALRLQALATVLPRLEQRGDISSAEREMLVDAYRFLRRSEHRIQMLHHQQQHQLPSDETDMLRLASSMGFTSTTDYLAALKVITDSVAILFGDLLATETIPSTDSAGSKFTALWEQPLTQESVIPLLEQLGFSDTEAACQQLLALQKSRNHKAASALAQRRLQRLLPNLLAVCAKQNQADAALGGTLRLLDTILRRSAYLSLLYENPTALHRLCQLCAAGEWITDWLCQHPVLLDDLIDSRSFAQRPTRQNLAAQFNRAVVQGDDDLEQQMNRLRDQRNGALLRAAMLDINPNTKSGDLLTEIAELVLDNCLRLAWQQLVSRYGPPPPTVYPANAKTPGMLVVGYGKLGAKELSYRSDLDLVLLRPDCDADQLTVGHEPTPLHRFYNRVSQRLLQLLSTQTTSGRLYEVDIRLRPSGNAGPIVSDLQSFKHYQLHQAQTWEHQALVHSRPITGDTTLHEAFTYIRKETLSLRRNRHELATAIIDMRSRVDEEKTIASLTDQLKLSDGGMLDIEFFSQYLVLLNAADHSALTAPTATTDILSTAITARLIAADDGSQLIETYQQLADCRRQWELGQSTNRQALTADNLKLNHQLIQRLMNG